MLSYFLRYLCGKHSGGPPFPLQVCPFSTVIGRRKELTTILSNYEASTAASNHNPVIQIISAGAGMGKTDTACEYARQYRNQYPDGIFFFFLESKLTFSQSVGENLVAIQLQSSTNANEDFIQLKTYVQQHPRCLFIYDNADDMSVVEDHIPACPIHILVTTRRSSVYSPKLKHAHMLRLQPLQPQIAMELLLHRCNHCLSPQQLKNDCPSEYDHALYIVGSNVLDGLPLGVVHAAALLNRQHAQKTDRLKKLREMLEKNRGYLSIEPMSVAEWLRNYRLSGIRRKLEHELHITGLIDIRLLTNKTVLESSLIDKEKEALCNARDDLLHLPPIGPWKMDIDSVCLENKFCRPLLQAVCLLPSRDIPISLLHSHLSTVCEGADKPVTHTALHLMKKCSLLSYSENGQNITLHPLVQLTLQQYVVDKNNARQRVLSSLSATFIEILPSLEKLQTGHKLTDSSVMNYASQLYHVVSLILDCQCDSSSCQRAVDLACVLSIRLQIKDVAIALCLRRLAIARRSGDKQRLVRALVDAGRVHALQHKVRTARGFCQFALQLTQDGPSACRHTIEEWALLMLDMANAYKILGCYAEVESLATKVKDSLDTAGLINCYVYAQSLHMLAVCHNSNGSYSDAESVSNKALSVYKCCVPDDHPAVGEELACLVHYYSNQRKFQDAEKFLTKSHDVHCKSLPAQHPKIATSLRIMGHLYIEWGQYKKAEECTSKALEIIESAYLTQHEEAAHVMLDLGRCYCHQGKFQKSEDFHKRALKVRRDLFGDRHRNTATGSVKFSGIKKTKKYKDAHAAFQTALDIRTEALGRHHPHTAWTLYYLSLCCRDTGKHQEALPLLQQAVEIMKNKYGDSSDKTLIMVEDLRSLKRQMKSRHRRDCIVAHWTVKAMISVVLFGLWMLSGYMLNGLQHMWWQEGSIEGELLSYCTIFIGMLLGLACTWLWLWY